MTPPDDPCGFRPGTLVHAPNRLVPIESVCDGDEVLSCFGRPVRVIQVRWSLTGRRRCWARLRTRSGVELVAKSDRAVLMHDGWARISTLGAGDRVVSFVEDGPGAAASLWGDERGWQGRLGKMDRRSLRGGPFPVANLRRVARFDEVVGMETYKENAPTVELVLERDGGLAVATLLARVAVAG